MDNTAYDRPYDIQRSIAGILKLDSASGNILEYFASAEKPTSGFSSQQIDEEKFKAELILSHSCWRALIHRAEGHGYFKGQIGFLLDFCGATVKWKSTGGVNWGEREHIDLQEQFDIHLKKAEIMFKAPGLAQLDGYKWERALLCMGDYLMPSGRNFSFLANSTAEQASWKRLLRGAETLKLLKQLFDRLNLDDSSSLEEQLEKIITSSSDLPTWIKLFVEIPKAIEYCGQRAIRRYSPQQIYLLKKSQMNGAHAELFTYWLYQKLKTKLDQSQHLSLDYYYEASGTDIEPHIVMTLKQIDFSATVRLYYIDGQFAIFIETKQVENHPEILTKLCSLGFQHDPSWLSKKTTPTESSQQCLVFPQQR